ncbi:helix-turn-helix domain-containing protein [Streptosporangium saharense]|uniref:helix-turn-helix domain-containing protein n=1 Tax=Streptosporangium saharense TaxID=1706840 RepID=UPI0034442D6C
MSHSNVTAGASDEEIDELELLKLEQLAELWKVSKRTVEVLVSTGELTSTKIGWNRRVSRRDALAYQQRDTAAAS